MPQLDLLTFFTQFFWAILCLFLFYFFVSKLILPELTRVLKYRSKASAVLSSTGDRHDITSHAGQEGVSDTFSHSSGKSGSSTLYKYAISSSTRVLIEARQKKDTFLDSVTSNRAVSTTGERSVSSSSNSGHTPKAPTKPAKSASITTGETESDKTKSSGGEIDPKQGQSSINLEGSKGSSKSSKSTKAKKARK